MFDIKLVIYVIVSCIIVLYGTYQVKEYYKGLGAIIYFAGSLYLCIIYGIRWFGADSNAPTSWPPQINTCPDFLTYYPGTSTTDPNKNTCIDTIGVAKPSTTKLEKFPVNVATPPPDSKYYFKLTTIGADKNAEWCNEALSRGVTWEGITNGESCISTNGTPTGLNQPRQCS